MSVVWFQANWKNQDLSPVLAEDSVQTYWGQLKNVWVNHAINKQWVKWPDGFYNNSKICLQSRCRLPKYIPLTEQSNTAGDPFFQSDNIRWNLDLKGNTRWCWIKIPSAVNWDIISQQLVTVLARNNICFMYTGGVNQFSPLLLSKWMEINQHIHYSIHWCLLWLFVQCVAQTGVNHLINCRCRNKALRVITCTCYFRY